MIFRHLFSWIFHIGRQSFWKTMTGDSLKFYRSDHSAIPPCTHYIFVHLFITPDKSDQVQPSYKPLQPRGGVVFRYTIIPYSIFNRLRSISISYECYRSYTSVFNLIRLISIYYDRINLDILIINRM